ncbi:MAG: L-threonylcarbamoyladenylate synthase [Chitinophagaceae bacterium]
MSSFDNDITSCLNILSKGGLILYPTDTIWGVGCDATNDNAVAKIFSLKQRPDSKSMIILVADEKDIFNYVADPDKKIFDYLSSKKNPTTVIYENANNIAQGLISGDGTVAIRIVKDDFCKALITKYKKPIVSTSANISGQSFPKNFNEIYPAIKNGVDYIVQHRQHDIMSSQPSSIIKLNAEGEIEVLRP